MCHNNQTVTIDNSARMKFELTLVLTWALNLSLKPNQTLAGQL